MNKDNASFAAGLLLALALEMAAAGPPILIDRQTGKYLGNLSSNPHDPDSTSNPYGRYGSKYSPDSINNPYGRYGSKYSPDSPNNPYAANPPAIVTSPPSGAEMQPPQ
ncbi:MAG: hypothetical protein NTAFB09_06140 [Nitrosospira sp.]